MQNYKRPPLNGGGGMSSNLINKRFDKENQPIMSSSKHFTHTLHLFIP